jgi:uncharacterized membrane protein YccC
LLPYICPVLADVGEVKEFAMNRAYLLIAGVLTGAGVGLFTGHLTYWIAAGAAMGVVLLAAARHRPSPEK